MDAATITAAALETMAEVGLDRLTMVCGGRETGRASCSGGLYYYLPDKTTLLRSMADQICLQIMDATAPTGDWRLDALDLCHATRRTLLERRDATRVFAQSPVVASVGAVSLLERMLDPARHRHQAGSRRPGRRHPAQLRNRIHPARADRHRHPSALPASDPRRSSTLSSVLRSDRLRSGSHLRHRATGNSRRLRIRGTADTDVPLVRRNK